MLIRHATLHVRPARSGNVAILMVLTLPALLGFVAMALDWGAVAVARNQVQTAADAAAMAATTSLDDVATARRLAQAYAGEVDINGVDILVDDADVVVGSWDGATFTPTDVSPNVVKVTAYTDLPMSLTRLFGVDSVRIQATAGAGPDMVARRAPDIVVPLDVTGSMSLSELASEREAAQALLDCVYERSTGDSKMGFVLFTGVDTTRSEMLEVGPNYTALTAAISGIRGCGTSGMPNCSGTNQSAGMGAGLVMLEGANTPEGVGQAMLVMSDGEPNADDICVSGNYTGQGWRPDLQTLCAALGTSAQTTCTGSGRRRVCSTAEAQNQPDNADYESWADGYVAEAEAAEIDIYTVYYGSEAAGIAYMEDHVAAGDGFSLVAPTADTMAEAFEEICQAYIGSNAGLVF